MIEFAKLLGWNRIDYRLIKLYIKSLILEIYVKFFIFLQKTIDNLVLKVYLIGAVANFIFTRVDITLNESKNFLKKFKKGVDK